jgi:hypothetical protein
LGFAGFHPSQAICMKISYVRIWLTQPVMCSSPAACARV